MVGISLVPRFSAAHLWQRGPSVRQPEDKSLACQVFDFEIGEMQDVSRLSEALDSLHRAMARVVDDHAETEFTFTLKASFEVTATEKSVWPLR